MSIQFYQLIQLAVYLVIATLIWRVKIKSIRVILVIIAFVIFAVNPFRFKQDSIGSVEQNINRFETIPEKVDVYQPSFNDKQRLEFNALKNDSGELKNEIHN